MDCCNFPPEYRAQYGWGEPYGGAYGQPSGAPAAVPYSYAAYAAYAPDYASPHDHYARFSAYRYADYPPALPPPPHRQHVALAEHALLEYGGGVGGGYVSKEGRTRRALARREAERVRARTPAALHHHLPLPHTPTPPLECGSMVGRVPAGYCDPHISWQHYQMGGGGGGGGGGGAGWGGGWGARGPAGGGAGPLRHLAAMHDHCGLRGLKGQNMSMLGQIAAEGRSSSAPYSPYEESPYAARASPRPPVRLAPEYVDYAAAAQHTPPSAPPRSPPPPPPPAAATVPLPAFQQAFGSTEIGRFAEAFSRAEAAHDAELVAAAPDSFPEWDAAGEPAWTQPPFHRAIKCEDSY